MFKVCYCYAKVSAQDIFMTEIYIFELFWKYYAVLYYKIVWILLTVCILYYTYKSLMESTQKKRCEER